MKLFILLMLISFNSYGVSTPDFFKCKKLEECIDHLLTKEKIWGRFHANYEKGMSLWKAKPEIRFQELGKQGEQKLEKKGDKLVQVISLPTLNDPYELIISLNHEIVHFMNSHASLKYLSDNKKINNCITKYQIELLKDESAAFQEEIKFWDESPEWFKKHFTEQTFESKLLGKKVNYVEYYKLLKEKMSEDARFVEKRYVVLGQYPQCTNDLL